MNGATLLDPTPSRTGACVFCGTSSTIPFTRNSTAWRVIVCSHCGLGRTVPQPSESDTLALYAGDYADASAQKFGGSLEVGRRLFARAFAARIARRVDAGGRVLDIGCGDGKLLMALAQKGFTGVGTDLNPRLPETVPHDSGIEVHVGDIESAHLPDATFRVVVVRHVLEHLRNPPATLREIRRVIEPRGLLVVVVPNLASWQARLLRDHWFHLDLPRHLYHFTPSTLRALLTAEGFQVEGISHFSLEQNPYGWLQSCFNAAGGRWRDLYDQLRAPGSAHARPRDRVATLVAAAATPLCVALATIESSLGCGGTIHAWARPR